VISIEQVRLLESRVAKAISYVEQVNEENSLLKNKLDAYQKRIDELEVLIQRFKEDQNKIEDGILSALDRLNKFEDAMDKGISMAKAETSPPPRASVKAASVSMAAATTSAPAAPVAAATAASAAVSTPGALYAEDEEPSSFVFSENDSGEDDELALSVSDSVSDSDSDSDDVSDSAEGDGVGDDGVLDGEDSSEARKDSPELDIF
jgi:hypothetical protein